MEINGFEGYKPIRNSLRKFSREDLLKELVELSFDVSKLTADQWAKGYLPWEVLLIGKWVLDDWENINGNLIPKRTDINIILNKLKQFLEVDDLILTSDDPNRIMKFFRRMSFQQFWYQQKIDQKGIGRAIELFINTEYPQELENELVLKFGIGRKKIFDLFVMFWVTFNASDKYRSIRDDYVRSLKNFTHAEGNAFFTAFSIHLGNIEKFKELFPTKDYCLEVYDKTPLFKFPFVKIADTYCLWNIRFLDELLEFGLYDLLKEVNSSGFGTFFGEIFQNYIEKRLIEFRVNYTTESDLKKSGYEKQVDFLFSDDKSLLLIEAKGIEASRISRVNPTNEVLAQAYKKDIVKAFAQAHEVNERYQKSNDVVDCYLLIVTYKDLFLGNGEGVWDEFAKEVLEDKYNITKFNIAPEKVFFLSVECFENLLLISDGDLKCILPILKDVIIRKKNPAQSRLTFSQYLNEDLACRNKMKNDKYLQMVFKNYHAQIVKEYFDREI